MTTRENLEESYDKLRQLRDELKVQLNLGTMEVRQRWEKAEDDFQKLQSKMKQYADRGEKGAEKVTEEARGLMGDVRKRFEKLRKMT